MSKNDTDILLLLIVGVVAHAGTAVATWRGVGGVRLIAVLNLLVALVALAHWAKHWRHTFAEGTPWYGDDLAYTLFALAAAGVATGTLARWWSAAALNWTVLTIHGCVLLAILVVGLAMASGRGYF